MQNNNNKERELNKNFYESINNFLKIDISKEEEKKNAKKQIKTIIYMISGFIGAINKDFKYNSTYLPSYGDELFDFLESVYNKKEFVEKYIDEFRKAYKKHEPLTIELIIDKFWYYDSKTNEITWFGEIDFYNISSDNIFVEYKVNIDGMLTYSCKTIDFKSVDNHKKLKSSIDEFIKRIYGELDSKEKDEKNV